MDNDLAITKLKTQLYLCKEKDQHKITTDNDDIACN